MDIFNHFSCHMKLPVLLQHVVDHILDTTAVNRIEIYKVDIDPKKLQGFCIVYDDKPHNSINHQRVAWIGVSKHLSPEEQRLVICKELIHVQDREAETAGTAEQVAT